MTSTLSPPHADGPAARFAASHANELRERDEHRDRAARAVARMARDRPDKILLLSILGLEPAAETGAPGLESALAGYTRQVAELIGVPAEAVTCEVTDTATAYLGLTARTADLPQRDLMLVWDERLGWSVAIEPRGDDEPPVICRLGRQIAPPPATVAQFVADALRGSRHGQLSPVPARLDRAILAAQMTGSSA
ncbi:hypothetical protein ATK36_4837 [Amycolatopsis sulphurea]|uniref:DUF6292 domain-containing protein n=1 Tax=Amycolatopsis sulphurea TaxID=76022 RepID=A0A2A9FGN8_9PSEU|nr:DUF6292 family protein [Amycolatopsis sulphurea]PFG49670.1 hypothetical protein ATK36_4837 [Amycolatopsis sulphurea]